MKHFILPVFVLLLASCSEELKPVKIPFNGDYFYVTPTEAEGLFAWGTEGLNTLATDTADGLLNTDILVNSDPSAEAAKYCDQLVAYGQNDWYLPSIEELKALEKNSDLIPDVIGGMYWSSSQKDAYNAYYYYIKFAHTYKFTKSTKYKCLCVRKD